MNEALMGSCQFVTENKTVLSGVKSWWSHKHLPWQSYVHTVCLQHLNSRTMLHLVMSTAANEVAETWKERYILLL